MTGQEVSAYSKRKAMQNGISTDKMRQTTTVRDRRAKTKRKALVSATKQTQRATNATTPENDRNMVLRIDSQVMTNTRRKRREEAQRRQVIISKRTQSK